GDDLQQGAPFAVAGGNEYVVGGLLPEAGAERDRRRGVDLVARVPRVAPQELAVFGGDADQGLAGGEEDLPAAGGRDGDGRAVAGRVVLRLPDQLAALLIEGRQGIAVRPARVGQHEIAFDERGEGDAPLEVASLELLQQVVLPELLAGGCLQAEE